MSALLQPRLKTPKPAAPPIYNDTKGFKGGGKNQTGAKGKANLLRSLVLDGYPKFGSKGSANLFACDCRATIAIWVPTASSCTNALCPNPMARHVGVITVPKIMTRHLTDPWFLLRASQMQLQIFPIWMNLQTDSSLLQQNLDGSSLNGDEDAFTTPPDLNSESTPPTTGAHALSPPAPVPSSEPASSSVHRSLPNESIQQLQPFFEYGSRIFWMFAVVSPNLLARHLSTSTRLFSQSIYCCTVQ